MTLYFQTLGVGEAGQYTRHPQIVARGENAKIFRFHARIVTFLLTEGYWRLSAAHFPRAELLGRVATGQNPHPAAGQGQRMLEMSG